MRMCVYACTHAGMRALKQGARRKTRTGNVCEPSTQAASRKQASKQASKYRKYKAPPSGGRGGDQRARARAEKCAGESLSPCLGHSLPPSLPPSQRADLTLTKKARVESLNTSAPSSCMINSKICFCVVLCWDEAVSNEMLLKKEKKKSHGPTHMQTTRMHTHAYACTPDRAGDRRAAGTHVPGRFRRARPRSVRAARDDPSGTTPSSWAASRASRFSKCGPRRRCRCWSCAPSPRARCSLNMPAKRMKPSRNKK